MISNNYNKTTGYMLNYLNKELKTIKGAIKLQKDENVQSFYSGQKAIIEKTIVFVNSVDKLIID